MDKSSLDILALFKGIYHVNKVKAQDKKIKFSYHIESNVSQWVLSDRQLLNQIIINLVSNAIKFTDAEKSVTMSLGQKGSDILISVADEGIGMNEEQASRVFSPFEQADNSIRREFGGTGLGLSIVKKICDLMKGSIEVDSQLGKGSEFRVQIPIVKTGAKEINESHHQFKNNINVMVVDDNPINQKLMKSVLRVVGLKYCGYSSGREALDNLSSDKPDLILLDLHMPDMDGLDVLNAMKKLPELEKPLVFMVSADVFQETVKACKKAGALEFLSKPIDLKELKGFLSKYFPDTHQEGLIQVEDSNHANELNILFQRLHTIPYIEKEIIGDVLEEMRHLVDPNSSKYQDFLELEKISLTKDESEFKKSLLKFSDKMT
jgi:CheY-like chemotaxis protein